MHIFITGAAGYLGNSLAQYLEPQGHTVSGSSRRTPANPDGADVVIHTAHDFTSNRNIELTHAAFASAKRCSVKRQIFLSSYSARADAESEYGQTKYRLEQTFLDAGETVLRLGLVIGNGGLFAKQRNALLRSPVIPIIGGGTLPTAIIALQHFLDATAVILKSRPPGEYGLFYDERPSLCEFIRAIKPGALFLPLPAGIATTLLRLARTMHVDIPVDPDQIKALTRNQTAPWQSDLPSLLPDQITEFTLAHALNSLAI